MRMLGKGPVNNPIAHSGLKGGRGKRGCVLEGSCYCSRHDKTSRQFERGGTRKWAIDAVKAGGGRLPQPVEHGLFGAMQDMCILAWPDLRSGGQHPLSTVLQQDGGRRVAFRRWQDAV